MGPKDSEYRVYRDGERQIIERLSFPRFRGVVTFGGDLTDIEEVELLDKISDPLLIAKVMREAGDYLLTVKPITEE